MKQAWGGAVAAVLGAACGPAAGETGAPRVPRVDRECLDDAQAGQPHAPPASPNYFATPSPTEVPLERLGQRIAGEKLVFPDAHTSEAMSAAHVKRAVGTFRLCLGTDGAPAEIAMTRSTCFPQYDAELAEALRAWRYAPPRTADRAPIAVCTTATFVFQLQ